MNVTDAVAARRSVRGFLARPIAPDLLRELALKASRAASGGNLQPWHIDIVTGESLRAISEAVGEKVARREKEAPAYAIYPPELDMPYEGRRTEIGEAMYGHIGISRDDKISRWRWFANNFNFFGAPAGLFCTVRRTMGPPYLAIPSRKNLVKGG